MAATAERHRLTRPHPLVAATVAVFALVLAATALAGPVLPIRDARKAADAESLAFTQKQPWGDSYRVKDCRRGARASVVFCHGRVRGLDTYQLNRLHVCKLTIKARLVDRPAPHPDAVAARIVKRRCYTVAVAA